MRGLQLYLIKEEYDELMAQAEEAAVANEGIIPDELSDRLDRIGECYQEKMENCGLIVKNYLAEAEVIRNEEKALAVRRRSLESRAEWLKKYMSNNMDMGEVFETARVRVSFRKSDAVEIISVTDVPDECCVVTREPSKSVIKERLKSGQEVPGARLVEKWNLQVK
jgi:hypothetical protein